MTPSARRSATELESPPKAAYNLHLPSGSSLPWGNRDYDVNLVLADKAWDDNGLLWFNPFHSDGFLGDHFLTNWQPRVVTSWAEAKRLTSGVSNTYSKRFNTKEEAESYMDG
jgi:hypothetical protein